MQTHKALGCDQCLDEMLRDRLICGLAEGRCQQHLLAEVDLTFDNATKIAQAMKLAEGNVKELHNGTHATVSKFAKSRVRPSQCRPQQQECQFSL